MNTRNNFILLASALIVASLSLVNRSIDSQPPGQAGPNASGESGPGQEPYAHFYDQRSYPDRSFDVRAFAAGLSGARESAQARVTGTGFTDTPWRLEGPNNIGGRINAIAIDPNQTDTWLVGCATGGVFKTTDAGSSWAPIFDAQPFLAIGDITFEPGSSTTIYVGTGDPNVSGYPFIGDGLYRSTDAGLTWTNIGLSDTRVISKVIVDPADHNHLVVSAMGLPMARTNDRGVYVTTNGGTTWTKSLFVSDETGAIDLVISPSNGNVLFASTWDRIRNNQESLIAGPNGKVWKSTDGGFTWVALSSGLPSGSMSRVNLAMHPSDGNIVYAAFVNAGLTMEGIYKTTNGGSSWAPIGLSSLDPNAVGSFGWYFSNILLNPYDPSSLYLCGIQLHRTNNDGGMWEIVDANWDVHADKHDVAFQGAAKFLVATDGGLYSTSNNGLQFIRVDNIPNSQYYRVAVNPHSGAAYAGGLQDNGTVVGDASGVGSWYEVFGGDGFQPLFTSNSTEMVAEYQNGELVYSTDNGSSWGSFTDGIDPNDRRNWDMPVMAKGSSNFFTGTYRLYEYSASLGTGIWSSTSPDLTDGVIFAPRFHNITTIDVQSLSPDHLYVGTSDGNVHRRQLGAWTNVSSGLPDRYVTSVRVSPMNTDEVFVALSGYRYNDYVPHVFRSMDKGSTWTDISGDLPQVAVNDILVHQSQPGLYVVGTDAGVYATVNFGQNWGRVGTGMPFCPVYDMEWDYPRSRLIAGTHARSMLSFPIDSLMSGFVVASAEPQSPGLVTVYPNPCTERIYLRSSEPCLGWELWNTAGQQVASGANVHDGEALSVLGLARGNYLLRMRMATGTIARKVVLQ